MKMNDSIIKGTYSNLRVSNLDEAIEWYTINFGFEKVAYNPSFATMLVAPGRIMFLSTSPDENRTIGFIARDTEQLHNTLKGKNIKVGDILVHESGWKWFEMYDPDGNKLEIWDGSKGWTDFQ